MSSKKIKVLFRLRSLEMGGVPRVVLDLLRYLPKDKFDLALILNLYPRRVGFRNSKRY